MMRTIIIYLFSLLSVSILGQDYIYLVKGDSIAASIVEISDKHVKYKRYDYLEGPIITIAIDDINRIEYESGKVEFYGKVGTGQSKDIAYNNQQQSQQTQKKGKKFLDIIEMEVHAGVSIPVGRYSSLPTALYWSDGSGGGAGIGGHFGCKFMYGIEKLKGLSLFANVDFVINPLNKEEKQIIDDWLLQSEVLQLEKYGFCLVVDRFPTYVCVPITIGTNYTYKFNKIIGLWGEGALGLNISGASSFNFLNPDGSEYLYTEDDIRIFSPDKEIYRYKLDAQFTYQFGLGLVIWDKLTLGAHYYGTTLGRVRGNDVAKNFDSDIQPSKTAFVHSDINYNVFVCSIGYLF